MGLKDGGDGSSGMDVDGVKRQLEELRKLFDKFPALKRLRTQLQQLGKPKPIIRRSLKSAAATARVKAYMADHPLLTIVEFANRAGFDEKTLRRLLRDGSASRRTWDEVAGAMRTTREDLFKEG
jgi:hypothetical protein